MGNQQATLNRAVPSYPCGRAGLWGSRVALFSQKANSREPSEAIRSPPYPNLEG